MMKYRHFTRSRNEGILKIRPGIATEPRHEVNWERKDFDEIFRVYRV